MKSKISNEIWNKLILLFVAGLCLLYPGSMGSYDDTNTLKIGSSNNFPPIQFSDERSEVIGFSQELSDAVMSKLGVKYKHIHYKDKDTLFKDLKSGKIDFIQSLGYSSDRAKDMDFGTSIIGMPEVILVRKNQHNIFSLNSLYGKRVAALDSCVTHDYLKKYPGITLISVDSVADALYHLVNGDVEAFVYPKEIALYVAQNSRLMDKIKIVGKPTRRLSWSMVVRKGNKPLLDRLNAGIDKLKSSGEYDKIYQKWFGQEYFTGYTENEVKIITLFATFLSLLFGLSTGLLIYNRKVYRANNALKKSHELMDSVSRSQSDFITDRDTKLVFERMLDDILKLTESEIGFIGEVFYNRNREPYLQNHTFTDIGWGQETRELYEAVQVEGLVFRNLNSLFGAVLVTGKPVISNDPANDPRACGIPKGHPALTSFMGLPFFKKGELLGMVGIANREGGYDEGLVTYLKPFLATCSNLIEAMRVNNQRTEAESALRESKERFRQLVERSPDIVYSFSDKSGGIYYSPRLEAVLGYALEAFYNDPLLWYNQIVDEDKPIVDRA
ncbi:MAG: transporter substrate-binding domain-containing protein, partial [Spirochaetota bacterium]|nr:transporter substrate-binding domain-containing protein [Spirochaetota bacterium]